MVEENILEMIDNEFDKMNKELNEYSNKYLGLMTREEKIKYSILGVLTAEEAFEMITGKKPYTGRCGYVPPFLVLCGEIEKDYEIIKRMQANDLYDVITAKGKYYASSFNLVNFAYLSKERKLFDKAVHNLMYMIAKE